MCSQRERLERVAQPLHEIDGKDVLAGLPILAFRVAIVVPALAVFANWRAFWMSKDEAKQLAA